MPSSDPPKKFNMPKNPFQKFIPGDDCERPACEDTVGFINAAKGRLEKGAATTTTSAASAVQCPPRSAQLGRSSWDLLHSMVR
jgi:hypothetical protein